MGNLRIQGEDPLSQTRAAFIQQSMEQAVEALEQSVDVELAARRQQQTFCEEEWTREADRLERRHDSVVDSCEKCLQGLEEDAHEEHEAPFLKRCSQSSSTTSTQTWKKKRSKDNEVRLIIPAGATLPGSDPPGTALRVHVPIKVDTLALKYHDCKARHNVPESYLAGLLMSLAGCLLFPLANLTLFHCYLIATNTTTNEEITRAYSRTLNPNLGSWPWLSLLAGRHLRFPDPLRFRARCTCGSSGDGDRRAHGRERPKQIHADACATRFHVPRCSTLRGSPQSGRNNPFATYRADGDDEPDVHSVQMKLAVLEHQQSAMDSKVSELENAVKVLRTSADPSGAFAQQLLQLKSELVAAAEEDTKHRAELAGELRSELQEAKKQLRKELLASVKSSRGDEDKSFSSVPELEMQVAELASQLRAELAPFRAETSHSFDLWAAPLREEIRVLQQTVRQLQGTSRCFKQGRYRGTGFHEKQIGKLTGLLRPGRCHLGSSDPL
ncbi:hypothetical protein AK812_SmicGene13744 [Symbiodinium microadriaticum]|uniref:Uncharacterized protein n=1 Tax=Symbiodinium microadriaticum TaxID=2951 RepID=A0A1Q9E7C7_SYMMI|nr:hypothetical protein AK812_SmicGene13744 [Symbiodinium microadriaticum]